MALIAYHNDPAIKSAIIAKLEDHAAHDRLVKGQYWENGEGCAVGCTIKSGRHVEYEARFGIPEMLARLEDGIFEGLLGAEAMTWPVRFMSAVPVGADLSLVGWQMLDRVLRRAFSRVDAGDPAHRGCAAALGVVSQKAKGEDISRSAAYDAWSAAYAAGSAAYAAGYAADAARSAAYAAGYAAYAAGSAAYAAWSAAYAARSAAYAAWSAAYAAGSAADAAGYAAYDARSAAYAAGYAEHRAQASDLLDLLVAAPVRPLDDAVPA